MPSGWLDEGLGIIVLSVDGQWAYWAEARETVRVLESSALWGRGVRQVLVPSTGAIGWVREDLLSNPRHRQWNADEVTWRSAISRVLHLMASGQPVTIGRRQIEPLPHQLGVLDRALSMDPVRLLLADEVGLGKTIEAGLIFTELKARNRARRILVVAPKGVQLQWVAEMRHRFNEEFALVGPAGVPVDGGVNPWTAFDRVVCSLDAVKPLRKRAGWTSARLDAHNERRFQAVLDAKWDMVVFDEAHHVAGSTEDVARHELARELASQSTHVLLLSATPHSGKTEAFARLLGLLDPAFLEGQQLDWETVAPLVIRTEKRDAVDTSGAPLFRPRTTMLEVVPYGDRNLERALYEAVTDYVRDGYRRAMGERRPAFGFFLLLMQRLASSSTAAILAALQRRAMSVAEIGAQIPLFPEGSEQWGDLSGEEQYEVLMEARDVARGDELAEVEILLDLARKTASSGVDAKALFLLGLVRRLQQDEGDPSLKLVVFTEFVPTQEMLLDLFGNAGITAVTINGSMSLEEREIAQEAFRSEARVLVSTDAGGEGINLQIAHIVVNYDLPWNPMRIEQRIGRVDRIGQHCPVRAFNLVLENSVDQHVLRILEEKLWRILAELGADKWSDVLETTARDVEGLYAEAVIHPDQVEAKAANIAARTQGEIASTEGLRNLFVQSGASTDRRASDIARWMDLGMEAYARWSKQAPKDVSELFGLLPEFTPEESVPTILGDIPGTWSLWEARPSRAGAFRDCFCLFETEDGVLRPDLAERYWIHIAQGADVGVGIPFRPSEWARLKELAADHGYAPSRALLPEDRWDAPWLTPRLVVRVMA